MAPLQRLALLALILGLSACRPAPDASPPTAESQPVERPGDAHVHTLDNGLRVVTLEDHSSPLVAVQLFYHVGSKDEQPQRRGFAHMFEHMMFRGTPRVKPEEHMKLIQAVGGSSNAYTSFDETVYVQELPAHQLELALWLESERMAFLQIDAEGFHTERKVVAEEYFRTATQPYGTLLEPLLDRLFESGTYAWSPIGSMDDLAQATVPELQAFWETYYIPNNAVLVVVGDIEHDHVHQLAERYFGWIPTYPNPPSPTVSPSPQPTQPRRIDLKERNGPAPIVAAAWRTVPITHPDARALEMLGAILGGGESSRLYRRLVVDEELAMVAASAGLSLEADGVFGAGAVLAPLSSKQDAILSAIYEEVERLRTEGVTEAELERARNQALKAAVTEQLTAESKARIVGSAMLYDGNLDRVRTNFDDIRNITAADLQRAAQEHLDPQRVIEVRVEPSIMGFLAKSLGIGGETEPQEPEVAKTETPQPSRAWGKPGLTRPDHLSTTPPISEDAIPIPPTPPFVEETLPNGLRVVILPNHELPYVTLSLSLGAGGWADPEDAPGTASLAAQMLTRGTERYTYETLAEESERFAIDLGGSASIDDTSVDAQAVSDLAPEAFELLAEITLRPTFPEDALTLLKSQLATGLAIQETSPDFLADRALRRALYGAHPYARSAEPEQSQLEAITAEGLARWWQIFARPDDAVLYVAGDIEPENAIALAREHFNGWIIPQKVASLPSFPIPERQPTRILLIDNPTEQAQIRVAQLAFTRHHPDWYASRVLSHIFGGSGLSSWLNQSIRVDKGLTYGAYGGFRPRRLAGELRISTFSKAESATETLSTILEQVDRVRRESPSSDALQDAKRYLVGSFVLGRETPMAAISDHWLITSHALPDDYLEQLLAGMQSATAPQLTAIAKEHIDPATLTIVVVGPAATLQEPLSAIAPVEVLKP